MKYTTGEISNILKGSIIGSSEAIISNICIDSRSINNPESSIFIGLKGNIVNGHDYVDNAYKLGIRSFLVSDSINLPSNATVINVDNTLDALQLWATHHRNTFDIPTIAITGSNGKTIIKEWLSQLLSHDKNVVKSPKSYNSQIGVPLSLLLLDEQHEVGVWEAGISTVGEMQNLTDIIQPDIGVFSNLGDAHDSGFSSRLEKFKEKSLLFKNAKSLVFYGGDAELKELLEGDFHVEQLQPYDYQVLSDGQVKFEFYGKEMTFDLPFRDQASIQNLLASITAICLLGIDISDIQGQLHELDRIAMRLETKEGKWNSTLINDSYSSDLESLDNAVSYLKQIEVENPIIILSDLQDNREAIELYPAIANILNNLAEPRVITVGQESQMLKKHLQNKHLQHYTSADLIDIKKEVFKDKIVLIKGARKYKFESLVDRLSKQSHSATLEIDLSAIEHNLSVYASLLPDSTKIMTVIKASAYGSGSKTLSRILQHRQVAYMAVAYVDEGIELRESGVKTPILILNPDWDQLDEIINYDLEPEIYSIEQLLYLIDNTNPSINIHIKIDTGMHRLGILENEVEMLCNLLTQNPRLHVASIMSHLAGSEDAQLIDYTNKQISDYKNIYNIITQSIDYQPIRHICNTAAISRYPAAQMDMVRIGLGLYGIDNHEKTSPLLERVHTLKAKVMLIKSLSLGDSVGYNRKAILNRDSKIAVINIGYADGLMRNSGNGNHEVYVRDTYVPIIGNVCMDLTMIDVTDLKEIHIGDEVEIFGPSVDIVQLATANNTIVYEVLSRMSSRIKKVYINS